MTLSGTGSRLSHVHEGQGLLVVGMRVVVVDELIEFFVAHSIEAHGSEISILSFWLSHSDARRASWIRSSMAG